MSIALLILVTLQFRNTYFRLALNMTMVMKIWYDNNMLIILNRNCQRLYEEYTRSMINTISNYTYKLIPELELIIKIGIWNSILGTCIYLLACIFYLAPIEREIPNNKPVYVPKRKQWKLFKQLSAKTTKFTSTVCIKIQNWIDGSPKPFLSNE